MHYEHEFTLSRNALISVGIGMHISSFLQCSLVLDAVINMTELLHAPYLCYCNLFCYISICNAVSVRLVYLLCLGILHRYF